MSKKSRKKNKNNPNNFLEKQKLTEGYKQVIGIDEVGRGAWAGPVVVAAYRVDLTEYYLPGVADSKDLKALARSQIVENLPKEKCIILEGKVKKINIFGVGKVIEELISEIVGSFADTFFLIDGVFAKDFGKSTLKIIKGDSKHYSIACASNVAKVYRDKLMGKLDKKYPGYNFKRHVGYGTKFHREQIQKMGISPLHRLSFKPIIEYRDQFTLI